MPGELRTNVTSFAETEILVDSNAELRAAHAILQQEMDSCSVLLLHQGFRHS
jgi:hypothetical protein